MTQLNDKLPAPPVFRKNQGRDQTISGPQIVLYDDIVKVYRFETDPGLILKGEASRTVWANEGVKRPKVAYRIAVVTEGQCHVRIWNDEAEYQAGIVPPLRDEHRPPGFVSGTFNPSGGYHVMDADVPGTVWYCCLLRGKRCKTGTVPTYIELNQGDQLPVYSTTEPNIYILLEGELNMMGVGNIPNEVRSIRGDVGPNRIVSKIGPGPAKLLHCFLEDEDYGRLD
jgi:hypothetical protein